MSEQADPLKPFRAQVSPAALGVARQVLGWADTNHLLPQTVALYRGGGVQMEWKQGSQEARVIIHPDGVIEYLLHGQSRDACAAARHLLQALCTTVAQP
jgi:hypothetical protein